MPSFVPPQLRILATLAALAGASLAASATEPFQLQFRSQSETSPGSGRYHTWVQPGAWDPDRTALVICDMWDDHYCRFSALRVAEMAPRMNQVIQAARSRGALIIHCPSGCMDQYEGTPQRELARQAPPVESAIPLESWCHLDESREPPLPVQADQPCDDTGELRERVRFYTRQIETLEIAPGDAITDSAEAYYLMRQRGIENVILLGVHANMCVLGRPFGIRQLVRQGLNVALMRDMTDAMYNPAEAPYVSHFTGNDFVISHIERHWCPTVTSADILGDGAVFRFAADTRPHLVIVAAEDEYLTEDTLPAFALAELGHAFQTSVVYGDEEDRHALPGAEIIPQADLILLSVRRRHFPPAILDLFRAHVAAGKPLAGVRTASHPFHLRDQGPPEGLAEWRDFDPAVLGGSYSGHHDASLPVFAWISKEAVGHPILRGLPDGEFRSHGSLYKNTPLAPAATLLLMGRAEGADRPEPVAWTHQPSGGGRVFYASLGHPGDFAEPAFRTLLKNGLLWAAGLEIPDPSARP